MLLQNNLQCCDIRSDLSSIQGGWMGSSKKMNKKINCRKVFFIIKITEVFLVQILRTLGQYPIKQIAYSITGTNFEGREYEKRILNGLRTMGFHLIKGILYFIIKSLTYDFLNYMLHCVDVMLWVN